MPWGRIDDRLAMSAKIRGLHDDGVTGHRAKVQRAESLGVWVQVLSWVSGERSDGFVTADIFDLFGWPAANARLLRAKYERAPLVHRPDDAAACECMDGRDWRAGYDYLIHDYLQRNPSRAENDLHRQRRADLRDARLKALVYKRDGGCCRYCRSGPLSPKASRARDQRRVLNYDHVDPDQPAGPDAANFVVACARCNKEKGHRTPAEADMSMLSAPSEDAVEAMLARPRWLLERPPHQPEDHSPITDGSATKSKTDQKPITDRITDPITDRDADRDGDSAGPVRPETGRSAITDRADQRPEVSRPGRDGTPGVISSPAPPGRTGLHPDVYHRRSRADPPEEISGEPDWPPSWPLGSVPTTAPEDRP